MAEPPKVTTSSGKEFKECLRDADLAFERARNRAASEALTIDREDREERAARRKEGNQEAIQEREKLRGGCIETAASDLDSVASKSRSKELKERNESVSNKIESLAEACEKKDASGAEGVCKDLAEELDSILKKSGKKGGGDNPFRGDSESAE